MSKYNKSDYKAVTNLKAGKNTDYTVKDKSGNGNGVAYNSKAEAQRHIDSRCENGQDPMSWSTDWNAMGEALKNG